jgi:hypothetical protein
MSIASVVERVYWWYLRRHCVVRDVEGILLLYDLDGKEKSLEGVSSALRDAVIRIRSADLGFGEPILDHLRFVAALGGPRPWVATHARGYVTPFTDTELANPHFLACRIVWAATVVRIFNDAYSRRVPPDRAAAHGAAREVVLRFARSFPDHEEWLSYLEGEIPY